MVDRQVSSRVVHAFLAAAMTLVVVGCSGGLSEKSFDTDGVDWVLFTQSRLLPFQGGRQAEVFGFVEMDEETGCVYLHQPEFEISYPSVWPAGTVVTDTTRAPIKLTSSTAVRESTTSTERSPSSIHPPRKSRSGNSSRALCQGPLASSLQRRR
jgi:hypothetical protein